TISFSFISKGIFKVSELIFSSSFFSLSSLRLKIFSSINFKVSFKLIESSVLLLFTS
ncbi:hypothetical protein Mgra_00008085, partial [Meloidogyne graminicola]